MYVYVTGDMHCRHGFAVQHACSRSFILLQSILSISFILLQSILSIMTVSFDQQCCINAACDHCTIHMTRPNTCDSRTNTAAKARSLLKRNSFKTHDKLFSSHQRKQTSSCSYPRQNLFCLCRDSWTASQWKVTPSAATSGLTSILCSLSMQQHRKRRYTTTYCKAGH